MNKMCNLFHEYLIMFVKNVMRISYLEMSLIYKVHVVHDSFMGYMIQALLDICISCMDIFRTVSSLDRSL